MKSERWKKIEELFAAAQEQPPETRAEFLRQVYSGHPELLAEVESLLRAAEETALVDSSAVSSMIEVPDALQPGATLGAFEIVSLLGRGGMGEVYRARDPRLGRDVAIKILPRAFAADLERSARFRREAQAASALNHPGIVSIYDIGTDRGLLFIVFELVQGQTLADLLKRAPLPIRRTIEIGHQIAEAVAAAHAIGVVHRDLKPANIMLTRAGRVKILDFGLARYDAPGDGTTATIPRALMGTPGYMSPEQIRGESADTRTDIFSLGVIVYEMAAGRKAFRGGSAIELMNSVLSVDVPELPASCPPVLDRIVKRCTDKEKANRFQSSADLAFALSTVIGLSAAKSEPARQSVLRLSTAAAAVVAIGAIAYWVSEHSQQRDIPSGTTLRRLTTDSGLTTGASIAPDGRLVAYASNRGTTDNLDVYVQQVDTTGVVRITSDPADDYDVTFSPDGTDVAFRSDRQGGGIYLAPALGGEARLIVPQGRRPRFSPDGKLLLYYVGPEFSNNVNGSFDVKVFVRPVGGDPETQIGRGCRTFERTPVWSPDGRRILFVGSCGAENLGVWIAPIDGSTPILNKDLKDYFSVTPGVTHIVDQWAANPSRLLLSRPSVDNSRIVIVPVSENGLRVTGAQRDVTFGTGTETGAVAALNGRVALSTDASVSHIWRLPLNGVGPGNTASQVTSTTAGEKLPSVSRDGLTLAYISGPTRLVWKDLRSGKETAIVDEGVRNVTPVISADGKHLLYTHYPVRGSWRALIREADLSNGSTRDIFSEEKWSYLFDSAPEGSTLLLWHLSDDYDPSQLDQIYFPILSFDVRSRTTTKILQDPEYGVTGSTFSHDGRWIAFQTLKDDRASIHVAPFHQGLVPRSAWIPITEAEIDSRNVRERPPAFSFNDSALLFLSKRDGFRCIWAQRLTTDMHPLGYPFAVYHVHDRGRSIQSIAVSPTDVFFELQETRGNVWVLEPPSKTTAQ